MLKKRISFQIAHLKSLLDSENSCVTVEKNFKGTLSLLPFHLGYLKHAVKELLNNKISKYDPELNGIILGHSNIKVINSLRHSDSGSINLSYIADIYLFSPAVGQTLTGVINKKSKEHIGCLIHSAFNASIPKPRTVGEDLSCWLQSHECAQIGDELDFTVTKVDFTSRVPYISGFIARNAPECNDEEVDSGVCCQDSVEEENLKVKKKKRKSKTDSQTFDAPLDDPEADFTNYHDPAQISELLGSENPVKPISGKRKKSTDIKHLNDSNSSSASPTKKIKKEKLNLGADADDNSFTSVSVDWIKKERTSLSPQNIKTSSSSKKSKKKSLDGNEEVSLKKIKIEPSLNDATSSLLSEALEECFSPKNSGASGSSDVDKSKKKKSKTNKTNFSSKKDTIGSSKIKYETSPAQLLSVSPKGSKKSYKSIANPDILSPKINVKTDEKKSKKRKRSTSPVKSENEECFIKSPKKKKSKKSIDLDELTSSLLAESMSKLY